MILIAMPEILDFVGLDHARRNVHLPQKQSLCIVWLGGNVPSEIVGMED
jgi:hypothetical protein